MNCDRYNYDNIMLQRFIEIFAQLSILHFLLLQNIFYFLIILNFIYKFYI